MATRKIADDPRIDPRLKAVSDQLPVQPVLNVKNREELLAIVASAETRQHFAEQDAWLDAMNSEAIAPSAGLSIRTLEFASQPDGNTVKILFMRPHTEGQLPCVYYIHGGGMMAFSCFFGNYQTWGRMIAHQGVALALVDFRNCLMPSSSPEVAPFPAGLNDCVSGIRWMTDNSAQLNIDPKRIIVSGESGGGNLALASAIALNREGEIHRISGVYALCPYIAGDYPRPEYPSTTENNGIFLQLHHNSSRMAYGIQAFDERNPLAWPDFASGADIGGFPPTVISVNECDPLRDEGIHFYRLLLANGVAARCRQVMGTIHATEILPVVCPEISRDTARDLAAFCRGD